MVKPEFLFLLGKWGKFLPFQNPGLMNLTPCDRLRWWHGRSQEALPTLPPPKDGVLSVVGDGSELPKRGTQNPLAQKGRKSEHHPWFFSLRFVVLMVAQKASTGHPA